MHTEWLTRFSKCEENEKKLHRHLFLQKALHEVAHLLTPKFLEHSASATQKTPARGQKRKKGSDKKDTPPHVGKTRKKGSTHGEAGYSLEECLSGGRMFHEQPKGGEAFELGCLVLSKQDEKGKGKWQNQEIKNSFVSKPKAKLASFKPTKKQLNPFHAKNSLHSKGATLFLPDDDEDPCTSLFKPDNGTELDDGPHYRKA